MTTIKLSKPIQAHGEEVSVLELRAPTGKDIRTCGDPFSYEIRPDGGQVTRYDASVIARYVVVLAGIPISSFDKIAATDWIEIEGAVTGFFTPAPTPDPVKVPAKPDLTTTATAASVAEPDTGPTIS